VLATTAGPAETETSGAVAPLQRKVTRTALTRRATWYVRLSFIGSLISHAEGIL
jgi:hypothetical protein